MKMRRKLSSTFSLGEAEPVVPGGALNSVDNERMRLYNTSMTCFAVAELRIGGEREPRRGRLGLTSDAVRE